MSEPSELHQLADEVHDGKHEDRDKHNALSWFQALGQSDDADHGQDKGHGIRSTPGV